eukprot:TRINITY_DN1039_c0_g1_i2.p1 TRINITY_DN1039_c0_g1~~TRINITY_DN1039_c0_g1_i2.p1  ORF type:complete len:333 (+),score=46.47 TRINITY_DN1039_c0_g1_i2:104-1102(+)
MNHRLPQAGLFAHTPNEDGTCPEESIRRMLEESRQAHAFIEISLFDQTDPEVQAQLRLVQEMLFSTELPSGEAAQRVDRAMGCMLGMAVGDALGAPVEFEPVRYGQTRLTGMGSGRQGAFRLLPGQWTDDTSMGLCLADSLLSFPNRRELVPTDLMLRFLAWWSGGYNNAFRHDRARSTRSSVGLGGNISQSLRDFVTFGHPFTRAGTRETSGNGSLMRLAAVPVRFHSSLDTAMAVARQQSLTTHQGEEAAECCRLMTNIIVRAIGGAGRAALERDPQFQTTEIQVDRLASSLGGQDPDRSWNWKDPNFRYSPTRAAEQPGYIGSFSSLLV